MYEKLEQALTIIEQGLDSRNIATYADLSTVKMLIMEYIEEGYKIKETTTLGD